MFRGNRRKGLGLQEAPEANETQIVRGRSWGRGRIRWPRRDPETILKAVTRLNAERLANLVFFGAVTLACLCLGNRPVRAPQFGGTAFDDVMAAMPAPADYALAMVIFALFMALSDLAYAMFYWPRRVRINRSGQSMTWSDRKGVRLAAAPLQSASLVVCGLLYLWLSGRLGEGV